MIPNRLQVFREEAVGSWSGDRSQFPFTAEGFESEDERQRSKFCFVSIPAPGRMIVFILLSCKLMNFEL